HLADDFQHPFVMNAHSPYFLKQYPVINVVKTPMNVTFNCPFSLLRGFASSIDYIDNIPDCVLLSPVGAEAVAVRIKSRFAYRLYNKPHTFLNDPVKDGGNTQRSHFAVAFGDIHTAGWFGLVFA